MRKVPASETGTFLHRGGCLRFI